MTAFSDRDFFSAQKELDLCIRQEEKMFREHQALRFSEYKRERMAFLESQKNASVNLAFLKSYSPNIAVFAGSFNPFHKGHYNVLQKAERIFDKVIVAFGRNPDKTEREWEIPTAIHTRQIEEYNGLLTDFVKEIDHEVVVIRGLRNSTDFQYEQNQYRYIQELMPGIRIVSIFCDKEFEHISSSGIRTLERFGKHRQYLLD